jgi:fatty-acid desaturase
MLNVQRFRLAILAVVVLPTIGFIAAVWLAWTRGGAGIVELGICGLMFLATFVGIEVGYHRHFVHRSFCATSVVRHILGALERRPHAAQSIKRKPAKKPKPVKAAPPSRE